MTKFLLHGTEEGTKLNIFDISIFFLQAEKSARGPHGGTFNVEIAATTAAAASLLPFENE